MEYEKLYKESLERARKLHKDATTLQLEQDIKDYEYIFPELRESDDEKIRKALLEYFGEQCDMSDWNGVYGYQVVAWLEKQGEQKHAEWHKEDEQNLNACLGYIPDEYLCRWLKDVIHVKYDNPAWSEEDENKVTLFMQLTEGCDNEDELADWLKSLKDKIQPQWKPSEEQMEALAEALSLAKNCGEESAFDLRTLHEQLKKLKEE